MVEIRTKLAQIADRLTAAVPLIDGTAEGRHITIEHIGNLRETAGKKLSFDAAFCSQRIHTVVRFGVADNHDFQSYRPSLTSSFP